MPRYIDADIAIYEIDKLQGSLMSSNDALWKKNKMIYKGLCNARGIIDDIPTSDVVPKSEVEKIFEEIEKTVFADMDFFKQLKKKYTEGRYEQREAENDRC